jgi:hypothetical protein
MSTSSKYYHPLFTKTIMKLTRLLPSRLTAYHCPRSLLCSHQQPAASNPSAGDATPPTPRRRHHQLHRPTITSSPLCPAPASASPTTLNTRHTIAASADSDLQHAKSWIPRTELDQRLLPEPDVGCAALKIHQGKHGCFAKRGQGEQQNGTNTRVQMEYMQGPVVPVFFLL